MRLPGDYSSEVTAGSEINLQPDNAGTFTPLSDRLSSFSINDNGDTETSGLSRLGSPSAEALSEIELSPTLLLPDLQFSAISSRAPPFERSGSDFESQEPSPPPSQIDDEALEIALAPIKGRALPCLSPTSSLRVKNEPSEISDLGNRAYRTQKREDPPSESEDDDYLDPEAPLQEKLLANHHEFQDRRKGFIPRGHIQKVVNEESVRRELESCLPSDSSAARNEQIQRYVGQIFTKGSQRKSFIQIFAILVLTEKVDCIGDFLKEGIDDDTLPFRRTNPARGKGLNMELCPRHEGQPRIRAFDKWTLSRKINFEEWQWVVVAPFFHRGRKGEAKIFSLQDPAIPPFLKRSSKTDKFEIEEYEGGYGKVSKMYIHPDHHNLKGPNNKNCAFAIKKLNSKNYKDFKSEFDMLAMLGKTKHPHLVSLLGAYTQRNNNYLIFDWADSDLSKYWRENPDPKFDQDTVRWVAEQCVGLAGGLLEIHRYGSFQEQKRVDDAGLEPTYRKLYGRHGDIKPENILWFLDPKSPKDRGTLKICDFGVSEFHTMRSRSNRCNRDVAMSPYYRPPECELRDGVISRSYDIWTMGCLYLEFLAWLLGGWKLVREMVISRQASPPGNHGNYDSFDYPHFDINDDQTKATIKPAVTKFIENAHANPKCSPFVHDFLDIIQKHLLVVETNDENSSKRMSCGRLHYRLQKMYERCLNKPEYAIKSRPRTTK